MAAVVTTTRRPKYYPTRARVTPEAIEAFARNDWLAVQRACGLKPWQWSPLDAGTAEPPLWLVEMGDERALEDWRRARVLAVELEALAG